ncbi:hypothetical protein EBR57_05005 [bacterium]|nr:hypothetical protein [bacterium]
MPAGYRDKTFSDAFISAAFSSGDFVYSPGNAVFRLQDLKESLVIQIPNLANCDSSQNGIGPDLLFFLIICTKYRFYAKHHQVLGFYRIHSGSISVESGVKKLTNHYNIAKAYFAFKYRNDLIPRLNAQILLALMSDKKAAAQWNLHSVTDFYPSQLTVVQFDWSYMIRRIGSKLVSLGLVVWRTLLRGFKKVIE